VRPDTKDAGVTVFKSFAVVIVLCLSAGAAAAQSAAPPVINPGENAIIRSEMHEGIMTARAQEKNAAATRQQIQAIRAALRAKFAALHH
jgi:hypothetical protein